MNENSSSESKHARLPHKLHPKIRTHSTRGHEQLFARKESRITKGLLGGSHSGESVLDVMIEGVRTLNYYMITKAIEKVKEIERIDLEPIEKLVDILRQNKANQPIKAKISESLPYLLALFSLNSKRSLLHLRHKLKDMIINEKFLGGYELDFYVKTSILAIDEFPSTPIDFHTLNTIFFPTRDKFIKSEIKKFWECLKSSYASEDFKTLIELKILVLKEVHFNSDKHTLKIIEFASHKNSYFKRLCIEGLKTIHVLRANKSPHREVLRFFREISENFELYHFCISACFELITNQNLSINKKSQFLQLIEEKSGYLIKSYSKDLYHLLNFNRNWLNYSLNCLDLLENELGSTDLYYIEPTASNSCIDSQRLDLKSQIEEFIEKKSYRILYLFGKQGSGKTLTCKRLARDLLQSYHKYYPYYVSSSKLLAESAIDIDGIDLKHRKYVMFILDDIQSEVFNVPDRVDYLIYAYPFCKILITCQLGCPINYQHPLEDISMKISKRYLYINQFDQEQMNKYLQKRKNQSSNLFSNHVLLQNPLNLSLYLSSDLSSKNYQKLNRFLIYYRFMKNIVKRNKNCKLNSHSVIEKCTELAFEKYKENEIRSLKSLPQGLPLHLNSENKIDFFHFSFVEFLIALRFKHVLNGKISYEEYATYDVSIEGNSSILGFIADFIEKDQIKRLINLMRVRKQNIDYSKLAKNTIEIINFMEWSIPPVSFSRLSLQQTKFTHWNLTGFKFLKSDLRRSELSKCSLFDTNFTNSNLLAIKFDQEILKEAESISWTCALDFSHDDSLLAIGGNDKKIKIWNNILEINTLLFSGHKNTIKTIAFSHDSQKIASGSQDNDILVWKVLTGDIIYTLKEHMSTVYSVIYYQDLIISGSKDKSVKIWFEGSCISTLKGHAEDVYSVDCSANGVLIASAGKDRTIKVWERSTGILLRTLTGHTNSVLCVMFSKTLLGSSSVDRTIKLWDTVTFQNVHTFTGYNSSIFSICFSPNGRLIASSSQDKQIKVWDLEDKSLKYNLSQYKGSVYCVKFSNDGKRLVTGGTDRAIKIWNVGLLDYENANDFSDFEISGLFEDLVLLTREDGEVLVWEHQTNEVKFHVDLSEKINIALVSEDLKSLCLVSCYTKVRVWSLETTELLSFKTIKFQSCMAISKDCKYIADLVNRDQINIWKSDGLLKCKLKERGSQINSLSFSHDCIASGNTDCLIALWNFKTMQKRVFSGHEQSVNKVDFSRDNKILVSASSDFFIFLWDVQTGNVLNKINSPLIVLNFFVSFSSHRKFAAFKGYGNIIVIWNLSRDLKVRELKNFTAEVCACSFFNSKKLLTTIDKNMSLARFNIKKRI